MNLLFFVIIMFVLQCLYFLVGKYTSKNTQGLDEYFLAGKKVTFLPLMMTFLATQIGGGVVLGAAEEAYKYGWTVILYPIGAALGLMALGFGAGRKLSEFQVSTIAEIFEVVYGSKRLKQTASILSIVSLFMILVGQMIASHKFLVGMGLTSTPLFLLFWIIVIIYTAQGGLRAVISTDLVQAAFFSLVFMACFLMVGFSNPSYVFVQHPEGFNTSTKLFSWLLMPLLFIITEQDMGQRCFSGGSAQIVSRASFFSGLIMMAVCIMPVFFGVLARALNIEVAEGASVLMATIEATTGPWMTTLMGCAVLAAIISTATSLINAISSNLFNDFNFNLVRKMDRIKKITALISSGALISALYFDGIIDILTQSFELSVSCLFIPIAFALFYKKGRFLSALLAIAGGALGFVIFRLASPPFPREVMSILLSLTGFGLGFAIERKLNSVTLINKEN